MHKNKDNFIEYNIIISFLNKKRYRKRKKFRYIVHLILYMDIKILNVHLEFNSTLQNCKTKNIDIAILSRKNMV